MIKIPISKYSIDPHMNFSYCTLPSSYALFRKIKYLLAVNENNQNDGLPKINYDFNTKSYNNSDLSLRFNLLNMVNNSEDNSYFRMLRCALNLIYNIRSANYINLSVFYNIILLLVPSCVIDKDFVYQATEEETMKFFESLSVSGEFIDDIDNLNSEFIYTNYFFNNRIKRIESKVICKPKHYYKIFVMNNTTTSYLCFAAHCLKKELERSKTKEFNAKLDAIPKNTILNVQDYFTFHIDKLYEYYNFAQTTENNSIFSSDILNSFAFIDTKRFILYENTYNIHKEKLAIMFNDIPGLLK